MSTILLIGGGAIVVLTMIDLVWTTMSLRHAGPVTDHLSRALGSTMRWLCVTANWRRPLTAIGPTILAGTLFGWVALLWLGWTLVFLAEPQAILSTPVKSPAGVWERIYYVGFTISTLGLGDLVPGGPTWRILTAVSALTGLIAITVGITYLLSVLGAAAKMRRLAHHVTSLGQTPEDILINGWSSGSFAPLLTQLQSLTGHLLLFYQHQHAYPVLRFYYSSSPATAPSHAVALLDEAVTLLQSGVHPRHRPAKVQLRPLRKGIDALLDNLRFSPGDLPEAPPPAPDLARLSAAGIGVVDESTFAATLEQLARRRKILLATVRRDGWRWMPANHAPVESGSCDGERP